MKVTCVLCEKEADTKEEDVYVTVEWCFKEMLRLNGIEVDTDLGRVVLVCSDCWSKKLLKKLSTEDYYWIYDKDV
jgi:hypothetical protein